MPPRDPLPKCLPRACTPIGWRIFRWIFHPAQRLKVLKACGVPQYLLEAQARANGRSDRPGRRRTYRLPIPGAPRPVTYTPQIAPETGAVLVGLTWPEAPAQDA